MFKEHDFIVWGTYCKCGHECSILQNEHHPWDESSFTIKLRCPVCGEEVIIDTKNAALFYDKKIHSYFNALSKLVTKGIKQMGWYIEGNKRMKNNLTPDEIAKEYEKHGWTVELEYLEWYKSGYFINAYKK